MLRTITETEYGEPPIVTKEVLEEKCCAYTDFTPCARRSQQTQGSWNTWMVFDSADHLILNVTQYEMQLTNGDINLFYFYRVHILVATV